MTLPTPAVRDRVLALSPAELPAYVYDLTALREHAAYVREMLPVGSQLMHDVLVPPEA
ncbi:hypothetical protein [Streptomyces caniscabiei]|uniref:Uncharacterized protein n=2 Tax=Streptomyces caniscabiei TaxID=2746961 RepID=A0ABU4N5M2_9ACTN|nr:hypothetical protein [Streptomyces caniscabiei]MBE4741416.1 hypothetical protein [Streptomyces caniscabiei]MBE4761431.1 hypothetical protein [Streptomyces caniscabiei]MBE4789900.1 hypothetical protein [Streptomyces caniscabiei]MBE4799080.1 hypothetical protein [Streptomyces caniscabiei]MDX2948035.1 hypothetical protein [Streptomyces caniscabiei]